MRNKLIFFIQIAAFIFYGCQHEPKKVVSQKTSAPQSFVKAAKPSDNTLLRKSSDYLKATFKEDLAKGFIDSLSRNYLVSESDLNSDGKPEMFLGLQGPYFCGSGGCTVILFDSSGKLITRFTVTDFPIRLSKDRTKDWINLILASRGRQHLIKFNGSNYPSNPSVQPEITVNGSEDTILVLDIGKPGTFKGSF